MNLKQISPLNYLLIFVPIALYLRFSGAGGEWVFITSAAAILPLAGLMGQATEALADKFGAGIGGLLNATFGNAAELIIAVLALHKGYIEVVKASITGSILGNILLVLGASFLAGGLKFPRQVFNPTAAGLSATLLALSAIGLLVPAVFHAHLVIHHESGQERELSLEIAIVLFVVYSLMLLFSLRTHKHLYSGQVPEDTGDASHISDVTQSEHGHWSIRFASGVLTVATIFVAIMGEQLVGAIEEARAALGLSEIFVGVIVVAIVGNAAEHSTAILVAMKNRMELSYQIAVGSALQIALFVAPVLVFISYLPGFEVAKGQEAFNLNFSMLEVVAVLVSVIVVGMVAFDGESNWLEGLLLLAVYAILGIAFFHLPEDQKKHAPAKPAAVFHQFDFSPDKLVKLG